MLCGTGRLPLLDNSVRLDLPLVGPRVGAGNARKQMQHNPAAVGQAKSQGNLDFVEGAQHGS
jgi:hypothetical protein